MRKEEKEKARLQQREKNSHLHIPVCDFRLPTKTWPWVWKAGSLILISVQNFENYVLCMFQLSTTVPCIT